MRAGLKRDGDGRVAEDGLAHVLGQRHVAGHAVAGALEERRPGHRRREQLEHGGNSARHRVAVQPGALERLQHDGRVGGVAARGRETQSQRSPETAIHAPRTLGGGVGERGGGGGGGGGRRCAREGHLCADARQQLVPVRVDEVAHGRHVLLVEDVHLLAVSDDHPGADVGPPANVGRPHGEGDDDGQEDEHECPLVVQEVWCLQAPHAGATAARRRHAGRRGAAAGRRRQRPARRGPCSAGSAGVQGGVPLDLLSDLLSHHLRHLHRVGHWVGWAICAAR